jgi:hypothetical protein
LEVIALMGLITGISTSLSLAASEYLSIKSEANPEVQQRAVKSALHTGIAYFFYCDSPDYPLFFNG